MQEQWREKLFLPGVREALDEKGLHRVDTMEQHEGWLPFCRESCHGNNKQEHNL